LLTMRRGATDPVCGMKVDKAKAIRMDFAGETLYFCGQHCAHSYGLAEGESAAAAVPGEAHSAAGHGH